MKQAAMVVLVMGLLSVLCGCEAAGDLGEVIPQCTKVANPCAELCIAGRCTSECETDADCPQGCCLETEAQDTTGAAIWACAPVEACQV